MNSVLDATGALPEQAAVAELLKHVKISDEKFEKLKSGAEAAARQGVHVVSREKFSQSLSEGLPNLPALMVWGKSETLDKPMVAIVGTRGASPYGKATAMKFAESFARAGLVVVSGGAMGIDAASHEGALAAGGSTVAVLPSGADVSYPAQHRGLFGRIRNQGCTASQFACGANPRAASFLDRNGVIAAMALATVIIEAPQRSGSLNTANHATDMGRSVFVVPGSIAQPSFHGSHDLVRAGATLVYHPDQVLEDLQFQTPAATSQSAPTNPLHIQILGLLSSVPMHTEQLSQELGMKAEDIMVELTMLEIEGRIIRASGGICIAP